MDPDEYNVPSDHDAENKAAAPPTKISKPRKLKPKINASMLLGPRGFKWLRQNVDRLQFHGPDHEV